MHESLWQGSNYTLDIALRQSTFMDMNIVIQYTVSSCGKRFATVDAVPAHAVGIQIMFPQRSVRSEQDIPMG